MKQSVTITGENLNVVVDNASEKTGARMASKAEKRIAALKAKGVDTSCYFPLGTEQVVKIVDGNAIPVDMTDDVEKMMVDGGYINNYSLFRRWVMAQMFRMLREMEKNNKNFTEILQSNGYEYQWRMLERELNAQVKMRRHGDMENFKARNRWFNKEIVIKIAKDYIESLKRHVTDNLMYRKNSAGNNVYKHKCKGNPYIRLSGKDIFVSDIQKKVYDPLYVIISNMEVAKYPKSLYDNFVKFNRLRKRLNSHTKMSGAFVNAYKGSGAYFTMKNLIMFHGARFHRYGSWTMTDASSLDYLEEKAKEYTNEGWRLLGVMKELISDSNISLQGKIDEWKK